MIVVPKNLFSFAFRYRVATRRQWPYLCPENLENLTETTAIPRLHKIELQLKCLPDRCGLTDPNTCSQHRSKTFGLGIFNVQSHIGRIHQNMV